jgi:UDP-N-acetylglucosamine 2-epimerase (non-hydrolysing)
VAPVMRAVSRDFAAVRQRLIHTGQHYDEAMSQVFFDQLGIPKPDVHLGVRSGTHGRQTGDMMARLEDEIRSPDAIVVVYGDVNSTLAAALVAAKAGVPVAHVEAGLRSFDRRMPEEVNRVVVDHLSDVHFTTEASGSANLEAEGIGAKSVHLVGNVMIDSLVRCIELIDGGASLSVRAPERSYALVTLHRPANVDDPASLRAIVDALVLIARSREVMFPVHPRTRERLSAIGQLPASIHFMDPLGYLEFVALERGADVVITDSGGVQEETTFLGVPCVTLRTTTERPITIDSGTNVLCRDVRVLLASMEEAIVKERPAAAPPLWDGLASERIARVLCETTPLR